MGIIFCAIMLVGLAYVLAIGWEKTKITPVAQTERPNRYYHRHRRRQPPAAASQGGIRVFTMAGERTVWAE